MIPVAEALVVGVDLRVREQEASIIDSLEIYYHAAASALYECEVAEGLHDFGVERLIIDVTVVAIILYDTPSQQLLANKVAPNTGRCLVAVHIQ